MITSRLPKPRRAPRPGAANRPSHARSFQSPSAAGEPLHFKTLRLRVGRAVNQGFPLECAPLAAGILRSLGTRSLDLLAGTEGFLTAPEWIPVHRKPVEWGDMVRIAGWIARSG
jgi:hypothetical protein